MGDCPHIALAHLFLVFSVNERWVVDELDSVSLDELVSYHRQGHLQHSYGLLRIDDFPRFRPRRLCWTVAFYRVRTPGHTLSYTIRKFPSRKKNPACRARWPDFPYFERWPREGIVGGVVGPFIQSGSLLS